MIPGAIFSRVYIILLVVSIVLLTGNDILTNLGYDRVKIVPKLFHLGKRRFEVLQLSVCDVAEKGDDRGCDDDSAKCHRHCARLSCQWQIFEQVEGWFWDSGVGQEREEHDGGRCEEGDVDSTVL